MITNMRLKLILRYALILFAVSCIIFISGYKVYQKIAREMLQDSLQSYLQEEIYEFKKEALLSKIERHEIKTNNLSLQFFSFHYSSNYLLRADIPEGKVGKMLLDKVNVIKDYAEDFQEIKLNIEGQKWNFLVISKAWADVLGFQKQVAVVLNITPNIYMMHRYKNYGLIGVFILCLLSLLVAYKMADNTVKPLIMAYDKQKKFVSDVSHEMKTPLSVLLTYTEILEKSKGGDAINVLKSEVKNMSQMVENLLSLTRIENIKRAVVLEKISPKIIIDALVERMNAVSADRVYQITAEADDGFIAMEAQHLERLVTILLDNAIKYTPKNKNIKVISKFEGGKFILKVCDEGIGISQEDQKHIFERFYRVDKARNRQSGGNGLGLTLAKEIVALYNGKIEVHSEPNMGSEFVIILPFK